MKLTRTALRIWRRGRRFVLPRAVRAAVSLHSHSECSREKLDCVPGMARRFRVIGALFDVCVACYDRRHERPLDFGTLFWRPPLPPISVIDSECKQIERRLDRAALVSLTDHDTLEGPRRLHAMGRKDVPLSVEWSIPFDGTTLHLGVHNLPARLADEAERELTGGSAGGRRRIDELLVWLGESPETFVVLNHPYWDLDDIGALRHESLLLTFMRTHRHGIHALELNGYRTWAENRRVLPLAEGFGLPVVGGGDRHAYTPNTILNLSGAASFSEFAHELRDGRASCVVFPEYAEPHVGRLLQNAAHLLGRAPRDSAGGTRWSERVFMVRDGVERSLGSQWRRTPWWLSGAAALTRLLGSEAVRPIYELTRADGRSYLESDCDPQFIEGATPGLEMPRSAAAL